MKSLFIITIASIVSMCTCFTKAHAGIFDTSRDQPYAIVTAEFIRTANDKIQPVILNRIDGQSTTRSEEVIQLGKRTVVADLLPNTRTRVTQQTVEIDAAPCTRYFIAAKLSDFTTRRWELVILHTESIGECQAKFKPPVSTTQLK